MDPAANVAILVLILAGFWFIIMRPARKAQQRQQELQASLQVGDRVMLTSGIFGTVTSIDGDRVGLEAAPGTVLSVVAQAVARKIDETPTPDDNEE